MNSRALLRARNSLYSRLISSLVRSLRSSMGSAIEPGLIRQIVAGTMPLVNTARGMAQDLAYRDYSEFVGGTDLVPRMELNRFTPELWQSSVEKHTEDFKTLTPEAVEEIAMAGDYWARDAEWGQRADVAQKDPRIYKVARVDPEPPSCPFCTLLNSRGPVYVSKESGSRTLHKGDQCILVFVRKGEKDYPHSRSTEIAQETYKRVVKSLPPGKKNTSEILKALKAEHDSSKPGRVRSLAQSAVVSERSVRVSEVKSALSKLERIPTSTDAGTRAKETQIARYREIIQSLEGATSG